MFSRACWVFFLLTFLFFGCVSNTFFGTMVFKEKTGVQKIYSPPVWAKILSQDTNEDVPFKRNFVDLWKYVRTDANNVSELKFSVVAQTNSKLINCSVLRNRYVNCQKPEENGFGENILTISSTDSNGLMSKQNVVLRVLPVNDSPKLAKLPSSPVLLYVGQSYSFAVKAGDVDSPNLVFSDDANFFDIGVSDGVISFTPKITDVGVFDVNMAVTDGLLADFNIVRFNIASNNLKILNFSAPKQLFIGDNSDFFIDVLNEGNAVADSTAWLVVNDSKVFSKDFSIDANGIKTIELSWTPVKSGIYYISIFVDSLPFETKILDNNLNLGAIEVYDPNDVFDFSVDFPEFVPSDHIARINWAITNNTLKPIYNAVINIGFPQGGFKVWDGPPDGKLISSFAPRERKEYSIEVWSDSHNGNYKMEMSFYGIKQSKEVIVKPLSDIVRLEDAFSGMVGQNQEFRFFVNVLNLAPNTIYDVLVTINFPNGGFFANESETQKVEFLNPNYNYVDFLVTSGAKTGSYPVKVNIAGVELTKTIEIIQQEPIIIVQTTEDEFSKPMPQ